MRAGIYGKSLYLPFNFVANLKLLKNLSLKKFLKMKSKKTILCLKKESFHRRISTVCFYLHEITESAKTNAWLLSFLEIQNRVFLSGRGVGRQLEEGK